jgi:hypothetical protein
MGRLLALLLAVAVSLDVDIGQFVEIQRLSPGEMQQRFGLPGWCEPSVSAMRRPHEKIEVQITCGEASHPTPAKSSAATPGR